MKPARSPSEGRNSNDLAGRLWEVALRAAQRLGAPREDAEDIASNTVERYLAAPGEIDSPEAWARVVVRRRWCRLVLRRRRHVAFGPEHEARAARDMDWRPRDLARVVSLLREKDRRLLLLAASGISHLEIGRLLDLRQGAVGAYLARAVERARRLVQGRSTVGRAIRYEQKQSTASSR